LGPGLDSGQWRQEAMLKKDGQLTMCPFHSGHPARRPFLRLPCSGLYNGFPLLGSSRSETHHLWALSLLQMDAGDNDLVKDGATDIEEACVPESPQGENPTQPAIATWLLRGREMDFCVRSYGYMGFTF
jgi:hypothetical protein